MINMKKYGELFLRTDKRKNMERRMSLLVDRLNQIFCMIEFLSFPLASYYNYSHRSLGEKMISRRAELSCRR